MLLTLFLTALIYIFFYLLLKRKCSNIKIENKEYATAYGKLLSEENPRGFFKI